MSKKKRKNTLPRRPPSAPQRKTDLSSLFPTSVWTALLPNGGTINRRMRTYIETLRSNDPEGLHKSNMGGWHSPDFNPHDEEPKFFINEMLPFIHEALVDMNCDLDRGLIFTGLWAIINPPQACNHRHTHPNNFLSAAYYVQAPAGGGDINFYDPRAARVFSPPDITQGSNLNAQMVNFRPRDSLLVLFPSYLHHSVDSNQSDEDRIVISFNINLERKENQLFKIKFD